MGQTLSRQMVAGSKNLGKEVFMGEKIEIDRNSGPFLGMFTF